MLGGKGTVFITCSERLKEKVAYPVRDALRARGFNGIILSDEPLLPNTGWEPDSKVDSYLNASDALVALCTPDNLLDDGGYESRQNVILEIQRGRERPHLRGRTLVLKSPEVKLPSDINPTYEYLDPEDPGPAITVIMRQLEAWGVLPPAAQAQVEAPPVSPPPLVAKLMEGLGLGDWDEAARRAYALLREGDRGFHESVTERLLEVMRSTDNSEQILIAGSLLESIARLDQALVPREFVEVLAAETDFSRRSSAAHLLWILAEQSAGEVPLGLLGRLAKPSTEDWYVQAPAMAATKLLMLRRGEARIILDELARSEEADDRYSVATSLLDIAGIAPDAVPRDLAESVANDPDELVAGKGQEVLRAIADVPKESHDRRFTPFGM